MANGNTITIVGNLTRDPELRTTGSGMSVCDMGGTIGGGGRCAFRAAFAGMARARPARLWFPRTGRCTASLTPPDPLNQDP